MNRRSFGVWGLELTPLEFAQALAALGGVSFYAEVGAGLESADEVSERLLKNATQNEALGMPLEWVLHFDPSHRRPGAPPLPDARRLAAGWQAFLNKWGKPVRAVISGPPFSDCFWIIEELAPVSVGLHSLSIRTTERDVPTSWRWPLRVGVLQDSTSQQLREDLEKDYWHTKLFDVITMSGAHLACDVLLLPFGLRRSLTGLLEHRRTLQASCTIVLGRITQSAAPACGLLGTLDTLIRTAGIALAPVASGKRADWFHTFLEALAHNLPVDVALFIASRYISGAFQTLKKSAPIIFATDELLRFRLEEQIALLGEKLAARTDVEDSIDLSPHAADHLRIPPGRTPLHVLGRALTHAKHMMPWDHESDSASVVAEVKRSARRILLQAAAPEPETRWIQAQVFDQSNQAEPVKLTRGFKANTSHSIDVRIGTASEEWAAADAKFPDKLLPPDPSGHDLTVVFSEPRYMAEPQTATLHLPSEGDSGVCTFYLRTREQGQRVSARITIVYQNRVLQTALLRADVLADPAHAEADHKIALNIEAVIRPGMTELGERSEFDAALILNHDDDNVPGVTKIAGAHASFSSPPNLDDEIKWFDGRLSEIADDPDSFAGGLKADGTTKLLRDFAAHGSLLYEAIVDDRISEDSIVRSRRLQVISAEPEARLPIEFFYDREAPLPDAPVCEHAEDALTTGDCVKTCPHENEQSKVVCPIGFWGLNRIIERHAHDKKLTASNPNWDFTLQAEPVSDRHSLDALASALFAANKKVDKATPNTIESVQKAIEKATAQHADVVSRWEDWTTNIGEKSPSLLVLMVHTEYDENKLQRMEIGEGSFIGVANLNDKYVRDPKSKPAPLVLLIGCETGAPELNVLGFVAKLRRVGAAIVVSSGSTILGRHAGPVTQELISEVAELTRENGASFGDVMLRARQRLLARGFPMVLCLNAYGDADWQLSHH